VSELTIQGADKPALAYVEQLLSANGLPADDVRTSPARFFVAVAAGKRVGVGGFEQYGEAGLLRSVVVAEPHRGAGYGTALCDALEEHARREGVATLHLLTTTAAPFFRQRGYEETNREATPEAIRETTEFSELCPTAAACLRKRLDR